MKELVVIEKVAGGGNVGGGVGRKVADHVCGDTQGNFHFLVAFTVALFPCNVVIIVDF